jgi:hypothetical protein
MTWSKIIPWRRGIDQDSERPDENTIRLWKLCCEPGKIGIGDDNVVTQDREDSSVPALADKQACGEE